MQLWKLHYSSGPAWMKKARSYCGTVVVETNASMASVNFAEAVKLQDARPKLSQGQPGNFSDATPGRSGTGQVPSEWTQR